jgi:hypothetical protein
MGLLDFLNQPKDREQLYTPNPDLQDQPLDLPDAPPMEASPFSLGNFDENAVKKENEDYNKRKASLGMWGALGDALTGGQSMNLYTGQSNPGQKVASSITNAVSAGIEDPNARRAKILEAYKDDNSTAAKAYKQMLINSVGKDNPEYKNIITNTPAIDLYNQGYSPSKLMEINASANVDFNKAKSLRSMEQGYDSVKRREEFDRDIEKEKLKNNTPKKAFDNLPEDKKHTITELSKKNAAKLSIKNQIDAVMSNWDSLPEDQKVTQGRQLLKTLNSVEGSDAIGAEEAKRLGARLEYSMGNFTNSNPTQFGRDVPGFAEQARDTAKAIGTAVKSNQALIDEAYGRTGQTPDQSSVQKTPAQLAKEELERRRAAKAGGN